MKTYSLMRQLWYAPFPGCPASIIVTDRDEISLRLFTNYPRNVIDKDSRIRIARRIRFPRSALDNRILHAQTTVKILRALVLVPVVTAPVLVAAVYICCLDLCALFFFQTLTHELCNTVRLHTIFLGCCLHLIRLVKPLCLIQLVALDAPVQDAGQIIRLHQRCFQSLVLLMILKMTGKRDDFQSAGFKQGTVSDIRQVVRVDEDLCLHIWNSK